LEGEELDGNRACSSAAFASVKWNQAEEHESMRHRRSSFTKVVLRWASKFSGKPRIWSGNGCENARRPAHCVSSHVPRRLRADDSLHHQRRQAARGRPSHGLDCYLGGLRTGIRVYPPVLPTPPCLSAGVCGKPRHRNSLLGGDPPCPAPLSLGTCPTLTFLLRRTAMSDRLLGRLHRFRSNSGSSVGKTLSTIRR